MSNDIEKKQPAPPAIIDDGFAGWEDGAEGDDRPQGGGLIQGTLIKFTNEARWVTRDGEELPANLELAAVDVNRVAQKWHDQQLVETIILESHQKFPDIAKMNAETPQEEWIEGPDGNMRGPWQRQHILYLLDLKPMDKFTFPIGTIGGAIAIRELVEKIVWMRRLRGPNVYPMITLSDTFFPTRFGGRQRPHFVIQRWVRLGGEGGEVEALPSPTTNELAKPADKPASQTSDLPLTEVKEPTLAEEMGDEIPDFVDEIPDSAVANPKPKTVTTPKTTARRELKPSPANKSARASSRRRLSDAG
jgi:hypothetical protein